MNKETIYQEICRLQDEKIADLKEAIAKVHESVIGEENSTAGNKFETARAMGQEELDRLNRQLSTALIENTTLSKINGSQPCNAVQLGALVSTDKKNFYVSIPLGEIKIDGKPIYAISFSSPVCQAFRNAQLNDTITIGPSKEKMVAIT